MIEMRPPLSQDHQGSIDFVVLKSVVVTILVTDWDAVLLVVLVEVVVVAGLHLRLSSWASSCPEAPQQLRSAVEIDPAGHPFEVLS